MWIDEVESAGICTEGCVGSVRCVCETGHDEMAYIPRPVARVRLVGILENVAAVLSPKLGTAPEWLPDACWDCDRGSGGQHTN